MNGYAAFICIASFVVMFFVAVSIIVRHSGWNRLSQIVAICLSVVMCCGSFLFMIVLFREVGAMASKPVIYFYPEEEMNISVKLSKPENITCNYPEYNEGWNVIAKPNGDLHDVASGKDLYCLYYECSADVSQVEEDGFVVKSAGIADFLDEKLEILGLNDKERNEFIIYWLPILEANEYNYIRFLTEDEINEVQQFDITPKPDTVIRIMMSYKGLDKPIEVKEQELKTAERAGFTVVEWGGTEIK